MRIAYVTAHFPPDFVSGATLQVQRLAAITAQLGHDVEVFSGAIDAGLDDGDVRTESGDGVTTHWIGTASRVEQGDDGNWINPHAAAAAARFFADFEPDVVHIHTLQTLGVGVVEAALDAGVPVIVTMHDMWWWCSRLFLVDSQLQPCPLITDVNTCACARNPSWRAHRAERLIELLDRVDYILTPSAALRALVIANGVDPDRVAVDENDIGTAAEIETLRDVIPPEAASPETDLRVLYIGGDSPLKGADVIRQVAVALRHVDRWRIDAYGLVAPRNPPPQLRVHTEFEPAELSRIMSGSDVLVIPSIARESYSIAAREALAAGLPVITSDCLGPEEVVVNGVNGLVVPTGDVDALADAITQLIGPTPLLAELQRNTAGHTVIARSSEDHGAGLIGLYRSAISSDSLSTPVVEYPGVVMFITGAGETDAPRALRHAEALRPHGSSCQVISEVDLDLAAATALADVIVLHQVATTPERLEDVGRWQRAGTLVIVDADDDRNFESRFLQACDGVIAATSPTAQQLARTTQRPIAIVEDSLSLAELRAATGPPAGPTPEPKRFARRGRILRRVAHRVDGMVGDRLQGLTQPLGRLRRDANRSPTVRIVVSQCHDDLGRRDGLISALDQLLAGTSAVDVVFLGTSESSCIPGVLEHHRDRCRTVVVPEWSELPGAFTGADIHLAPAPADAHVRDVRWLSAAAAGVPTMTSAVPLALTDDDDTTVFVHNDQWETALRTLVADRLRRRTLGAAAQRAAELGHGPHRTAQEFRAALSEIRSATNSNGAPGR